MSVTRFWWTRTQYEVNPYHFRKSPDGAQSSGSLISSGTGDHGIF